MKKNKRMVAGMKKLLIVMMTALLVVSLFGCKDTSSANKNLPMRQILKIYILI